jgi:hypothetical protein
VRDESSKGSDVIGFKYVAKGETSDGDTLYVYEVKTRFTGGSGNHRLQDAIDGSAKDEVRIGESLNYVKQKLYERRELDEAGAVERWQSPEDSPYKINYGATTLVEAGVFSAEDIKSADASSHPHSQSLSLLVIRGSDMMRLVHDLYDRAANEA